MLPDARLPVTASLARLVQARSFRLTRAARGVPIKAISEMLGHATSAFTADVYTEVAEELAESAASAIAAIIPRHATNVPAGGINDR